MNINPLLLIDGYKCDHRRQYPEGTEIVFSNFTPRKSRVDGVEEVVFFGLQYFVEEYLVKQWNEGFFDRKKEEVVKEYSDFLEEYLGPNNVGTEHIEALHDLGYLPIRIRAVPEGTLVPMRVPVLTIVNTHPEFFWLTNYLETIISSVLWKPITSATTAFQYRKEFERHAEKTGYDKSFIGFQGHDFSFRGMSGLEDVVMSGAGHLLSFVGTDSIPAIQFAKEYYNAGKNNEMTGCSVPACYDDKTEILTDEGWKLFKDLNKNELVAQYNSDKTIEFVKPLEYFEDPYNGKMIQFSSDGHKYVDVVVTPNHRMVREKNNKIEFFEAGDFSYKNRKGYSHRSNILVGGNVEVGEGLSSLDKLKIAFQADGSFPSHKDDYNNKRGKGFPIRFSLKKERKKKRLIQLCEESNCSYSCKQYKNGYYSFWINVQEEFVKDFSWVKINNMSYNQCYEFISELQFWGGYLKNNCIVYSSINKNNIDIVQAVASLCGCKTHYNCYDYIRDDGYNRKTLHSVIINLNKNWIKGTKVTRKEIDYDGFVYCVSVPSKMLIVRRNNKVIVSGNTEHSVMCAGSKEGEFETFKRLITETYPNGIVSIVSDSWDFWKVMTEYLPALKDDILARDGRTVIRPDSGNPIDIICGTADENYNLGSPAHKGAYEILWETFGGTLNDKGYKELNPKIGLIYGDSITTWRQQEILRRLEEKGFSASNLVLGIGSFTYEYVTRDTFGFAMKATWAQINGKGHEIFKDPVTDSGMKKSAKGLLKVVKGDDGRLELIDQTDGNLIGDEMRDVFVDGVLISENTQSFEEIRNRLLTFNKKD